jgi:hypothetical protein
MHAEDFRVIHRWDVCDMLKHLFICVVFGAHVNTTLAELVIWSHYNILVLVNVENVGHQSPVEVICDVSAIVNLASHELKSVPRNLIILKQEVL